MADKKQFLDVVARRKTFRSALGESLSRQVRESLEQDVATALPFDREAARLLSAQLDAYVAYEEAIRASGAYLDSRSGR